MAIVPFLHIEVGELFEREPLFENPGQALAWMDEHIDLVTLAKKPGTAEFIDRLKLSLASGDKESESFATLSLVRLIEAQAAWLQGKSQWSAIGRSEALKAAVAAIRDSNTSQEANKGTKTSFIAEHRKVLCQIDDNRPNAEAVSQLLADPAFASWAEPRLKQDWNRSLMTRCGEDIESWVLVAPNSLNIMASSLKDLRRQYDAKLLRPTASRQPVKKNPGSAARRHPRIAKSETSSTEPATANSDKGLSAKVARAKSKKG